MHELHLEEVTSIYLGVERRILFREFCSLLLHLEGQVLFGGARHGDDAVLFLTQAAFGKLRPFCHGRAQQC